MAQVLDLRGRQLASDHIPVLLDPSGGRARVLAWVGRGVAGLFLIWLIGLVFAGLGLLPSGDLPFGRAFVGQSPPVLKSMPPITQPRFAGPSVAGRSAIVSSAGPAASAAAAVASAGSGSASGTASSRSGAGKGSGTAVASGHGQGSSNGVTGVSSGSGSG